MIVLMSQTKLPDSSNPLSDNPGAVHVLYCGLSDSIYNTISMAIYSIHTESDSFFNNRPILIVYTFMIEIELRKIEKL